MADLFETETELKIPENNNDEFNDSEKDLINLFENKNWSLAKTNIENNKEINIKKHSYKFLIEALDNGCDIDVILSLIKNGADPKSMCKKMNSTVLHCAAETGKLKIVEYLIDKCGCDPNAVCVLGFSPLHCCFEGDNIDVVHKLINSGANVNAKSKTNLNVISQAVASGNIDMVALLEKNGADLFEICGVYGSALHNACRRNRRGKTKKMIEYLLERNFSFEEKDSEGKTAYQIAKFNHNDSALSVFDEVKKLNQNSR